MRTSIPPSNKPVLTKKKYFTLHSYTPPHEQTIPIGGRALISINITLSENVFPVGAIKQGLCSRIEWYFAIQPGVQLGSFSIEKPRQSENAEPESTIPSVHQKKHGSGLIKTPNCSTYKEICYRQYGNT